MFPLIAHLAALALNVHYLATLTAVSAWYHLAALLLSMLLPLMLTNCLSLLWLLEDREPNRQDSCPDHQVTDYPGQNSRSLHCVSHCLLAGVMYRVCSGGALYFRAVLTARSDHWHISCQQLSDASLLRLMLIYIGGVPQLVMRVLSVARTLSLPLVYCHVTFAVVTSVSLVHASVSHWVFSRRHSPYRRPHCRLALAVLAVSRVSFGVCRVVALVCLCVGDWRVLVSVLIVLYCVAVVCVGWSGRSPVMSTSCRECYLTSLLALLLLFLFIDTGNGPSRYRYAIYRAVSVSVEVAALISASMNHWSNPTIAIIVYSVCLSVGLLLECVNHCALHPAAGCLYRHLPDSSANSCPICYQLELLPAELC